LQADPSGAGNGRLRPQCAMSGHSSGQRPYCGGLAAGLGRDA
jgi:hypothetical protein